MSDRIENVLMHTEFCLGQLRGTENPGALSGNLALNWRGELGPRERGFLFWTAWLAAENDTIDRVMDAEKRRQWLYWVPRGWEPEKWWDLQEKLAAERDRRGPPTPPTAADIRRSEKIKRWAKQYDHIGILAHWDADDKKTRAPFQRSGVAA